MNLSFCLPKLMLYVKYDLPNNLKIVALYLTLHANILNLEVSYFVLSRVPHISSCIYMGVTTAVIAINHIIYKSNNDT